MSDGGRCGWCGHEAASAYCSPECERRDADLALSADERDRAEYLAGQRAPEALICSELGLSARAWGRLRRSDVALREALGRGRAREHRALLDALFAEATEGGNVQAAMFLLRCRHGYNDRAEGESTSRVKVEISLPAALTPDQYAQLRAIVAAPRAERNVTPRPRALPAEGAA